MERQRDLLLFDFAIPVDENFLVGVLNEFSEFSTICAIDKLSALCSVIPTIALSVFYES